LLFVQGGQTLIYRLGKTDAERTVIINTLGRKWELTFTTLVTFGGAFFASFPLFYSTSFGGAYWVWIIILLTFVLQAVSYEFRSKPHNLFGSRAYEIFLYINGLVSTILIGTVVATFFTGSQFSLNTFNQPKWQSPWGGLELVLDFSRSAVFVNLSLGIAVFFLARVLALLYVQSAVNDTAIVARTKQHLCYNALPFLVFFLTFIISVMLRSGFGVDPQTGNVSLVPYKYFLNFREMPAVFATFIVGVILVLAGIVMGIYHAKSNVFDKPGRGIWFSGAGTILTVFALFLIVGLNDTSFYPSTFDLKSSLTIQNASSSHFTLATMSYVSLFIPFVLAYIWYTWRLIDKKRIDSAEFETGDGKY
jgi:cytochrome d ubiquinol oxidase subunit II